MPDNPRPNPAPSAAGEFNFVDPETERPRLRRRTLKPNSSPSTPPSGEPAAGAHSASVDQPQPDAPRKTGSAPAPAPTSRPYVPPSAARPGAASSRPATPASAPAPGAGLYYSTGALAEKKEHPAKETPAPPMKTSTPHSSTTAASAAPASAATRIIGSGAAPGRAASLPDYRANIDRQSREQKSVGGVLAMVVYALIAFFVLGAILAGYGTYTLSRQIHQQSVTMNDLDSRNAAQNKTLTDGLAATDETLAQAQAQIRRDQEIILRQQDTINKLVTANDNTVAVLRQERQTRAGETASLRARVKTLEEQPRLTP